jgi:IgGFc binding protein
MCPSGQPTPRQRARWTAFAIVAFAFSAHLPVLPVASWKTDHIVTTPRDAFYLPGDEGTLFRPTTDIVAAQDDTEVTVVPSVHIAGGQDVDSAAKGVTHTYRMRKGEQIRFMQDQDLTGTRISANKPVGVWAGHECMNIPTGKGTCDTSETMLFPVPAWGREYVLAPYISRKSGEVPEDYLYRVTGAVDGTVLTYEPGRPKDAPGSLSAGESVLFSSREPFVVKSQDADHPFAAFAYMTGYQYVSAVGNDGDPEFLPVVPAEQSLSRYVFFVDPKAPNSQLVVVRSRDEGKDFEPVVLECVGTLEGWSPIGTSGKHEFTRVRLTRQGKPQEFGANTCGGGRYTIESKGPIAVNVWGTGPFASYAYPGGAALRTLNSVEAIVK